MKRLVAVETLVKLLWSLRVQTVELQERDGAPETIAELRKRIAVGSQAICRWGLPGGKALARPCRRWAYSGMVELVETSEGRQGVHMVRWQREGSWRESPLLWRALTDGCQRTLGGPRSVLLLPYGCLFLSVSDVSERHGRELLHKGTREDNSSQSDIIWKPSFMKAWQSAIAVHPACGSFGKVSSTVGTASASLITIARETRTVAVTAVLVTDENMFSRRAIGVLRVP